MVEQSRFRRASGSRVDVSETLSRHDRWLRNSSRGGNTNPEMCRWCKLANLSKEVSSGVQTTLTRRWSSSSTDSMVRFSSELDSMAASSRFMLIWPFSNSLRLTEVSFGEHAAKG
ncbi:hypothetical protein OGAPHI_005019 [Ogataea philodendri]|uniref:Uncharacterized protein n=1 Tax=Ogataea philodendri TaxID=1378263 RepID=A0A9P8T287_9ASCO|nr:uncharacterized protein OGAPHI_005019 [Ogataea philodendri]KAH3663618.1 hypothetical protein OGAPHI_005019 [Ogataea philodendri]